MGTPRKKPIKPRSPPPPPTPKQPKPWDAPPSVKWGNDNPNDIYLSVGQALTNWELFGQALGEVFVALVGTRSYEAMRAYSAVVAHGARLEMIAGAAEAFFLQRDGDHCQSLKERVSDLLEQAENFASRRNEIAHGVIGIIFGEGAFEDDEMPPSSWVLTPSFYARKKRKMSRAQPSGIIGLAPVYEYSSVEIDSISSKFRDLRPVAQRLAHAIRHQRHREKQASLQKPS
jgi:hypothetical protein